MATREIKERTINRFATKEVEEEKVETKKSTKPKNKK